MIRQIIQSIRLYLNRNGKFYGLSISQIGFVPNNKSLYRLALLHKSASKMTSKGVVLNYERLEFLGDAVLGAIVAELLYKFFPKKDEGFLTRVRSKVVSRESLKFIFPNFFDIKDLVTIDTNYKSRLIEWGQKNKVDIHFQTDEVARGRRKFCCTVMLSEEEKGKGEGTSKKEAEQNAAKIVIDILSKEADGNIEI